MRTALALLAALGILTACVNPATVAGRTYDPWTGAVTDAQPTRLADGSTGWQIDCTPNQSFCQQRANLLCGGVAEVELITRTNPTSGAVANAGSGVAISSSTAAVYSVRATC